MGREGEAGNSFWDGVGGARKCLASLLLTAVTVQGSTHLNQHPRHLVRAWEILHLPHFPTLSPPPVHRLHEPAAGVICLQQLTCPDGKRLLLR